ncbi:AsnC family transcriptional regulator [Prosthecomicrobium hirschii]|uniref:AsnC family transcriptional regulator n=2 Tax=Prosthecodimorpha hirschii TaxID=665126 RepID=A0A0P6W0K4_9HYPH|nr:AsnC family transcriptional regulator [Prosthecomicrobium hirschii]
MGPGMVSTAHRLRDEIEGLIVTGVLAPGEKLDEVQLANRFAVSRTPIREALQQLAAAGFVEIRLRRGATVVRIGPERLVEMFEVMAELEAMCARLAARRLSDADRAALLEAHASCRAAAEREDPDAYYYENERFHYALYRAARNGVLEEEARRMHARLKPYRRLQLRVRNRVGASWREHDGIVQAILDGDPAQAADRARAHVTVQGERFADLMASLAQYNLAAE